MGSITVFFKTLYYLLQFCALADIFMRTPYQVVERIGPVVYRVVLPTDYQEVHDMFHISSLRKSFENQKSQIVSSNKIQL